MKENYKNTAKQLYLEYGDTYTGMGQSSIGMAANSVSSYTSPAVSQDLSAFTNQHPTMYYPVGQHKVDFYNSDKADAISDKDIQQLKKKVTPDEILMGMDYEMKKLFHKNKSKAKEIVVQNLKKDPEYYSQLHMLMPDVAEKEEAEKQEGEKEAGKEEIKENVMTNNELHVGNIEETKKILDDMINARKKKENREVEEKVVDAFKDSIERRKKHL